ncbi:MAG TPA: AlkA N-terminal domain-containing protein [Candidatus Acidoferrales bacterium]|jgi:AraC family transcriptional regulator of adaptative response / DNA-3-methyladenine glycosylase II|nr:AlkA N-terminal domain-containing protein [Candidatus Acidoferrales bacterium]
MTTYSAVVTTGIYCRPGCGAKPLAENVRTFELAAAAEAQGFRACLRCRPYRIAGPADSSAPELVCRAVRLVLAGALDDGTEETLAAGLGISPRHLRRLFNDHLGATPDQLARSRRAHFARRLLDDSDLSVTEIAFASGFGSLRQFNRAMHEVFRATPKELRGRRRRSDRLVTDGGLAMRLPFSAPFDWDGIAAFLAERAVPGVESVANGVYRRTISLDGAPGVLEVEAGGADYLLFRAHLPYWEGLIHVVERVTRMAGIDTDISPAVSLLANDPTIGALVSARPGVRVPGAWGPFEAAVHAITAQGRSLTDARDRTGALVRAFGEPVPGLAHGLTHLFPSAEALAKADVATVDADAAEALRELASRVVRGDVVLDGSVALGDLTASLTSIPGVGANAAQQIALRLGERDAFPEADPHVAIALSDLKCAGRDVSASWRPWRAVAATHLATYGASRATLAAAR